MVHVNARVKNIMLIFDIQNCNANKVIHDDGTILTKFKLFCYFYDTIENSATSFVINVNWGQESKQCTIIDAILSHAVIDCYYTRYWLT